WEAGASQRARGARTHRLAVAQPHGIPGVRVDAVLAMVGLEGVGHRRAGGYSLGMAQRLGVAAALLGDPAVVVLDEPGNGLDPDGVLWVRTLLKTLAAEGGTVLVSSNLMSEMAVTADRLVIIGRGQLLAEASIGELTARVSVGRVLVRSPQATDLRELLVGRGATVTSAEPGVLQVDGLGAGTIADLAVDRGLAVHELTPQRASLEQAYMELTRDAVQYQDQERVMSS